VAKLYLKKSKRKHHRRKSDRLLPGGIEALVSLFKDQFISCKAGKLWAVLWQGLGWLAGLLNTTLSQNTEYSYANI
jgi:hypothetical protein